MTHSSGLRLKISEAVPEGRDFRERLASLVRERLPKIDHQPLEPEREHLGTARLITEAGLGITAHVRLW